MNTGWTQEGKIKVLHKSRDILCGRNPVTTHDRSTVVEPHSSQDGISLKYMSMSRDPLDPPGMMKWILNELKQRHGESALLLNGNRVGDCIIHDNGEFSIHLPDSVPDSIVMSCSLRCLACAMSEFLSYCNSVNASHKRPKDWLCGAPSTDQDSLNKLADVLVCQNSHCGEYHTIGYKFSDGAVQLEVSKANFTLQNMTEKRMRLQTALVDVAMLPPVLARVVVDYLIVIPYPCLRARQRDIDEKAETIHPIDSCDCWCARLWSQSSLVRSTDVRELDILVHGCRELKGKEAKLVYKYKSRPTRQLYGCGPFEVNIVLGLVY